MLSDQIVDGLVLLPAWLLAPRFTFLRVGSRTSVTAAGEMKEAMLDELAQAIYPLLAEYVSLPTLQRMLAFLMSWSNFERKQLITLCRGMSIPPPGTTLYAKTSTALRKIRESQWSATFEFLCTNPLYAGLLIALSISLPMSDLTIRNSYLEMLAKEMKIMESTPLPTCLNFNPFFGEYTTPIHPSLDPNPRQAAAIHSLIDKWIISLEEKEYILPHITSKLCAKSTQEAVKIRHPEYVTFEEDGATQSDLEYIYMTTGDTLDNTPCEVKQRWYTSGLTPRTYYAAGADAYHRSKYVRNALNSLCDFLPPTERYSRVNPHRILLSDASSHALIYDLTSFTSNMHEQRHFMERLSLYCRGHIVRILDTCEGVVSVDLGHLLSEYNTLNNESTYSSDRLVGSDLVLSHHVAGFLGVYGNLASCTFLHGAVMCQIVDSFSQLGVAGDDGLVESYDDYTTFFTIRLLGLMEESKGYNTADEGWQVYLKRPIRQVLNRLYSETFALYSMFEHLFEEDDLRFFPASRSTLDRKGSLASSVVSYLRSFTRMIVPPFERDVIYNFLLGVYRKAGFPIEGYLPQASQDLPKWIGKLPVALIPTLDLESIGHDPIEHTIRSLYDGVAVLPDTVEDPIDIDRDMCYGGCEFVATSTGLLSLYRKLGFVELMQDSIVLSGEEGLGRLIEHYSPNRRLARYTVSVVHDIPLHLLA